MRIDCVEPVTATPFGELPNDFVHKIRLSLEEAATAHRRAGRGDTASSEPRTCSSFSFRLLRTESIRVRRRGFSG